MNYFTSAEVKKMFPTAVERTYPKGQILLYPGDKPGFVSFIINGTVKYYDIDDAGNEKIIHLLGPSMFFPMLINFERINEIVAFYGTLDDTQVLMVKRKDFSQKLGSDTLFANRVLMTITEEMREIVRHVNSISKTDSKQKVFYVLQCLLNKHSHIQTKNWMRVNFPINQQIIADLAGVTRETVSGIMQEFETDKVIRSPKLLVLDINKAKLVKI